MKKMTAATTVGLTAIALSLGLVGCGSDTKSDTKSSTSSSASSSSSSSSSASSTSSKPTPSAGAHKTIQDYIKENKIVEAGVKRGDPGAPSLHLPMPPGWVDAGPQTPEWAYAAILFKNADTPTDPPSIIAIVSKLTGNVDPAKVLEYATGEVQNLPGYESLGDPHKGQLSGFDAVEVGGMYTKDGKKRLIAQKTVVIPGQDGLYVLQMNADALEGQEMVLMDATGVIDEQTTITP